MDWKVYAGIIVLLLLLLWLLCRLLSKLFKRRRAERKRAQAAAAAAARQAVEQARRAEEARRRQAAQQQAAEEARKAALVERVMMQGDPLLAEILCAMAGTAHDPLRDTSADRERVLEIARRVNEPILQVLAIAATQSDIDLDLEQQQRQEEVAYPTRYIEPVRMRTLEQLSDVIPEQLLLDDDAFYTSLAQQDLIVLQPYERWTEHKTLEILWDVSGSMNQVMADGLIPRHNWARGIAVSLLLKALKGGATYLVRPFDASPHPALRASNPEEAAATIKIILDRGASDGGTNIRAALRQAINDVRTAASLACGADILLLTDGEDHSVDDVQNVQAELGTDIRLHVASIGTASPALQAVATTYNVFQ